MDQNHTAQSREFSKNDSKRPIGDWFRNQFHMRPANDDEPQVWWFASTAIPLIAATTGPVANAMSIIALASPWRNSIDIAQLDQNGITVQTGFRDPRWCTALNATSLACGVIGNLFLLFNFTRTVRYIIALPASIILWFMATGLLIGITTAMHIYQSPVPPGQTFSQAYWSAVIAAVLYFILCIILMINMLGYFLGHYPQHFALTDDQRTLILQTMAFMTWLIIGAAVFHKVMDIPFAEAVYFCDITILTLRFGDVTAQDSVARGLVLPYAVIGIIILGLVIGSIHRFGQEVRYDKVLRKHIEKKRKLIFQRSITVDHNEEIEWDQINSPFHATEGCPAATQQTSGISHKPRHPRKSIENALCAFDRAALNRPRVLVIREEKDRFDTMRAIQRETMRFHRWSNLIVSIVVFGIVWSVGAIVFWKLGEITYFEALYFCFCALLTIGYGDITPNTDAGRSFFIVWSLFAIPTMTILISELSDTIFAGFRQATNLVADWTILPHSEKYRAFMLKSPRIFAFLQSREANKYVTQKSPVRREEGQSRSLEELACDSRPSDIQLGEQLVFAI